MAVQTVEQLKAAFGAGKLPNVTNWEDLIDTIFSMNKPHVFSVHISAYDTQVSKIGNNSTLSSLQNLIPNATSPYTPIPINTCFDPLVTTEPHILIVNNDGAFYGRGGTENGEMYIEWEPNEGGEAILSTGIRDSRYYSLSGYNSTPKPQIAIVPVGNNVAFSYTPMSGYQPVGSFTSYDYDALMQKVQDNPY